MKWRILAVGKLRSEYARSGTRDYVDRIGRMQPLEIEEVHAAKGGSEPLGMARAKRQETQRLLGRIRPDDYVILFDERGAACSSDNLARKLSDLDRRALSRLVFVVGGAFGVDDAARSRANEVLSFGPMTFPHEMARLILTEQLYRALTIQRNIPYHHR